MDPARDACLRWVAADSALVPADDPARPVVIDSWLVEDGSTRALPAHVARFSAACQRIAAIPPDRCARFVDAAVHRIPATGRWFPRVELAVVDGEPRFQLWLRPAPPRGEAVRLWIAPGPDRRRCPAVKGPDLELLTDLRRSAVAAGADEALILSPTGEVREGATTSVLWWRDDILCLPPESPGLLPGITRAVLLRLAAEDAVGVRREQVVPDDLAGLEVWAVNALHGIRPVLGWVNSPVAAGPAPRADLWNRRLRAVTETAR